MAREAQPSAAAAHPLHFPALLCNKTPRPLVLQSMMTFASHGRFAAAVVIMAAALSARQDAVFKSDTRVVEIAVVAKDASDSPIADLRQRDLRVFDNGVEQIMLSFENLGVASGATARTQTACKAMSGATPIL